MLRTLLAAAAAAAAAPTWAVAGGEAWYSNNDGFVATTLAQVRGGPSIGSFSMRPAPNTTIYYVSASSGDDASGKGYSAQDPVVGADPFHPTASPAAFKTIKAAIAATTEYQPDWVLLKRGDSWEDGKHDSFPISIKTGASTLEPMLLAAYGEDACARPRLLTGENGGINQCCHGFSYFAVSDLEIYAHMRDPAVVGVEKLGVTKGGSGISFDGPGAQPGLPQSLEPPSMLCRDAPEQKCGLYSGVLIQNCWIRFHNTNIVFTGDGYYADVVIRNNLVTDAYDSAGAHSQGMFGDHLIGLQLTNNTFDHNGWLELPAGHPLHKKAGATIFNHNTYIASSAGLELVGNMFLRASSMGNKFRSDTMNGESDVLVRDNLYVEGELGIGIGGNVPEFKNGTAHFTNVTLADNVLVEIGRARPTNRTLSWGMDINDWRWGQVSRNLFVNVTMNVKEPNTFGLHVHGSMHHTAVTDNIMYNLHSGGALLQIDSDNASNITFVNNQIQSPFYPSQLGADGLRTGATQWSGFSFVNTTYFSSAPPSRWFEAADQKPLSSMKAWDAMVNGVESVAKDTVFPDSSRSLETFAGAHGAVNATFVGFWLAARARAKWGGHVQCTNGSVAFTATEVNEWLRDGFYLP